MVKIKIFLLQLLLMTLVVKTSAQCTCTVPVGITGFANCIEVTSTVDNTSITAASACDGSLRWAILKANTLTGGTYVKFNIPGTGSRIINLKYIENNAAMPNYNIPLVITSKIFIDGTSQPDYDNVNKVPSIVLEGLGTVNSYDHGLRLGKGADASIIKGIKIRGYAEFGIILDGVDNVNGNNTTSPANVQIVDNIIYNLNHVTYSIFSPTNGQAAIGIFKCGNSSKIYGNIVGSDKIGSVIQESGARLVNSIYVSTRSYFSRPFEYSSISNIQIGRYSNSLANVFSNSGTGVNLISFYSSTPYQFTITNVIVSRNIFSNISFKNINLLYRTGTELPPIVDTYANNNKSKVNITSCNETGISGTSQAGDTVEIFLSNSVGKDALAYLGTAVANGSGVWSLPKTSWINSNLVVVYGDKINGIARDIAGNTSEFNLPYTVTCFCPVIAIIGLPSVMCKNNLPITMTGNPSGGTFQGNGVSGNIFNPSGVTSGIQLITYTYSYPLLTCSTSQKVLIPKVMPYQNRVISSTATTYSDAWPIDYTNLSVPQNPLPAEVFTKTQRNDLANGNEITNGTKGIWRGEESYVYVEKRDQNAPLVAIKEDGIYHEMPLFNHVSALNGGCTPKWRLVNTMTEYNPSSSDLENKDILNRYSSALYGYKGDLAIAVSANAREREIVFESFEEYIPATQVKPENLSSGNLSVYTNTAPTGSNFFNVYKPYEILEATDHVLTVDFPFSRASAWNGKTVNLTGANMNGFNTKAVYGKYTIAGVTAHATDVNKAIVTLSTTGFTHSGIWKGKISVPVNYTSSTPVFSGVSNLSVVASKKHTGKNSLKTTGDASFEQIMLDLVPGEKYVLSAWVSTDQSMPYTHRPLSGLERRGFTVEFLDKNGNSIGTTLIDIYDKNPIIEGWQKIEGTFEYPGTPVKAEKLILHFKSPSGSPTYWDDIRLFPFNGNIQTYVYDKQTYKVSAVLDNNNYASLYYYDAQGNLFLVKKETEKGIQTIQESYSHQKQ